MPTQALRAISKAIKAEKKELLRRARAKELREAAAAGALLAH